ncbi:MAG: plasmid pRiA4b ORF-3 family protein [Candidatus Omnitrophica bacterium]|nr:plasmid pRiA4b ORF-3 family protein [Candidatus Omnitrophota bacterium]
MTDNTFQYPSADVLKWLFFLADGFRMLAPWRWMGDREVVAVRDPLSDRIAYCVVMGMEGTCFGLEAMLGDRGLAAYRKTISEEVGPEDMDALHIKDSFVVFLDDDKRDMGPEDLDLLKQAGVKWTGPHRWPKFRRFEPGFYPWLLNEQDTAFMAVCLEQVAEVAFRAMKDTRILGPRDHRTFAVRIPSQKDGKIMWRDELITPEPLERIIRIQPKVDQASLAKILHGVQSTPMTWEADCFFGQMPVAEPGERPHYPWCYMIADKDSGFVFDIQLTNNDYGAGFIDRMCEAFRKHKVSPIKVLIRQPHLMSVFLALEPFGIKTEVVKDLPMIDEARMGMFKAFEQGMFGSMQPSSRTKRPTKQVLRAKKTVVYQFKVSLDHVRPSVWRRIQVKSDITLKRLAATLLVVMGWENNHLHEFHIGGRRIGLAHDGCDELDDFEDEDEFCLCDFSLDKLKHFVFEYDFGDGWKHSVSLERTLEPQKGQKYPTCLAGERHCPPEDCGGPRGYMDFLEAIGNPDHPDHERMMEWSGGGFNPGEFNVDIVNYQLKCFVRKMEKGFDEE